MSNILITGGRGFLGRNLAAHLRERKDCETSIFDLPDAQQQLEKLLLGADVVFHLAGVNRPKDPAEFEKENAGLTEQICDFLRTNRRAPKIVFSSSIQAELDNPYGVSKAHAEQALRCFAAEQGAQVRIYRLKNLFGKWCRPNYNSVTATFCHQIANELPIFVSDPDRELELSYVDDVVNAFLDEIGSESSGIEAGDAIASYRLSLGELAGRIQAFHDMRCTLTLPDFSDRFNRALYATYLSYLPAEAREERLVSHADSRGSLAEFVRSPFAGQIFVSRTKPGVTRGNHYHHTKTEKFFVVEGEGLIRLRAIDGSEITEHRTTGSAYQIVNIPPGITHSITNVGSGEMVTLFWSSERFDPNVPDTYFLPVDLEPQGN